ncbi:major facilitator superfamily MFS_1 [Flexistipes sinusarabici DSM 4947]|uniref:Major facilitator superfamily MFS_1 n=1 Tax=Flexistipes sinusarabici (strain ATCC 49648 / DSM 4947 / MAS 10) TaxID=717231 RepID=F8E8G0_FLESM|nr:MFS transporter [Flexistipes sinusarabici]AEI14009.1 major facilitator superfamily MFS_1 [Flexistipes sinusarabici DSM 4947]
MLTDISINSRLFKATILSLSLLTIMAGAVVSPVLANIAHAFSEEPYWKIKLVLTMPALFIIVFALLNGKIALLFSKKKVTLVALILYILGGAGGGLSTNLEMLLVFRALLGISVGLLMPLATGLIADFYSGETRANLMGKSTATSNLGGIIGTLISGFLAEITWQASFTVYLLAVPVFIMALFFLKDPEVPKSVNTTPLSLLKRPLLVSWMFMAFLTMIIFYTVPVNIAIYIEQMNFGESSLSGVAVSLLTGAGFVAGLSFSKAAKFFSRFFLSFCYFMISAGFLLIIYSPNTFVLLTSLFVVGLGLGWTVPNIFTEAVNSVPDGYGVAAMGFITPSIFLGQFFSPIAVDFAYKLAGLSNIL